MSLSWFGVGPLDGTSQMNQDISQLRDNGTLWVNSAGNYADSQHWNGTWNDPDGDDFMEFGAGDENLTLTGGSKAKIYLNWDDWAEKNDDYDLHVYNDSGGRIGNSTDVQNGSSANPGEHYADEDLPSTIHLRIERVDATGEADFDIWFLGNYEPEYWTAERSVVNPAVGPNVTTTGAVYYDTLSLRRFSSRGPTIDGRIKPDLTAPDGVSTSTYNTFTGTSAAAPHAGGVAALVLGADESRGPDALEQRLLETATPLNGTEPENGYGYGLVDAESAITLKTAVATPNQTTLDFGHPGLSETATRTVSITNDGEQPLNLSDIAIEGENAADYTVASGGGQHVVEPSASHNITVSLDSDQRGYRNATLTLTHNGTDGPTAVALTGLIAAPDIRVTPSGPVAVGSVPLRNGTANASVGVENNGTAPLNVTSASLTNVAVTGSNTLSLSPTGPIVLQPNEAATVNLTASVSNVSDLNATIELAHNVSDSATVTREATATGVDSYPPIVSRSHVPANVSRDETVTVAVEATDESGIATATVDAGPLGGDSVTLEADGGHWFNETVTVDTANATEGTHRLQLNVTDGQGRTNRTETTPVTVDLTNATVDVDSPTNGSQNETSLHVNATASDSLTDVRSMATRVDGGSWQPMTAANGAWNLSVTGLTEGTHTVAVRATDGAGNTGGIQTRSVTVDTTDPSIANVSLNRTRGIRPETPLSVTANVSDDGGSGIARVSAANTTLSNGSGGWTGVITAGSALGSQSATVTAVDTAGNPTTATATYRVGRNATLQPVSGTTTYRATTDDTTIPAVRIDADSNVGDNNVTVGTAANNPTADGLPNGTAVRYPQVETTLPNDNVTNATVVAAIQNETFTDRYVPPETVRFWAHNGTAWNRTEGTLRSRADGTSKYAINTTHFSAFAVAGTIEDTPPTIESVAPANGSTVSATEPTIEVQYTDDFSGIDVDAVSLSVNGTAVTDNLTRTTSSISYTPTLSVGRHTVTVNVTDAAGNVRNRSWSFTVAEQTTPGGGGGGGGGGDDEQRTPAAGADTSVTVDGEVLQTVEFSEGADRLSSVTVTELTESPAAEPAATSFVTGADIDGAGSEKSATGSVRLTLRQSRLDALGVGTEQLTLYRLNEATGQWDALTTTVRTQGDSVTVEGQSVGAAVYAVFSAAAAEEGSTGSDDSSSESQSEAARTATGESGGTVDDGTATGGSGPGFTVGLSLVALLVVAVLARRNS
jgi:PGF-pre-PGF domain-containing protein/PGF-CTERM protein